MIGCLRKIVSGGQTGADRGGLDAALAHGLEIGGWASQGYRAEDGIIPERYRVHMRESVSPNYGLRTRLNVQDSDGTLLLSFADTLTGGSKFTVDHVKRQKKPCKHLVLPRGRGVVPVEVTLALWDWLEEKRIAVLNIAGPRESKERGLQAAAEKAVGDLFKAKASAATSAVLAFCDARDAAHFDIQASSPWWPHDPNPKLLTKEYVERFHPPMPCAKCGSLVVLPVGAGQCRECDPEAYEDTEVRNAREEVIRTAELDSRERLPSTHAIVFKPGKPITPAPAAAPCPECKATDLEFHADWCGVISRAAFASDCAHAIGAEAFLGSDGLIERYYRFDGNGAGGSLHIVLDDGNHERSSVEFCLNYAVEHGDKAGEALARALLALPDDVYDAVLGKYEADEFTEGGTDA